MTTKDWRHVEPLGELSCSSVDCEKDLHCFRRQRPRDKSYRNEKCINCGVNLIDWERLDKRDLKDTGYTFQSLKYEMFRHHYWHIDIDEIAINNAKRKGLEGLRTWATKRLDKHVRLPSKELFRDGTQTPLNGNVVFYAQHATACCCRKCMEEWHGIDRNRPLTDDEIQYFTELIMLYIQDRLPNLPEQREKLAGSARTKKSAVSSLMESRK